MAFDAAQAARGILTENLNLKLLSLAFALVLYALVHGGGQDWQRTVLVSVDRRTPPETADRVLVTQLPTQLRVTLRGPRAILDDLKENDIGAVQIDVHNGTEARVAFEAQMVHVPAGVKVDQIDPPSVDLVWEDRVERDVPIQVSVVGSPAAGFVVKGAPLAEPPMVRARGAKSAVMVLQHARADAFDVNGLTEGKYTRTLAIDKPRDGVVFELPSPSVNVTLEVTREVVERPFTKVPVAVVGQPKAKTQPADVDVRLTCPPEVLRGLRAEQIVPRVQVTSSAERGSEALPVQLAIDKCDVHITPATVIVRWAP